MSAILCWCYKNNKIIYTFTTIAQHPKQPTRPRHSLSSLLIKRLEAAKHESNKQKPASNLEDSVQLESATKPTPTTSETEKRTAILPSKTDKISTLYADRNSGSALEQQQPEHSDTHLATVPCVPQEVAVSQVTDVTVKVEDDTPLSTNSDSGTKHHKVVKHSVSNIATISNKQKVEATLSPLKSKTSSLHIGDTLYEKKFDSQEFVSSASSYAIKAQDVRTAPSAILGSDCKYSEYQEPEYDGDVSVNTTETDDSSQVFEELFGSSGGEDENDDISSDLELAGGEMEQRRAEEEFRRITTQSTDLPHASVSGTASLYVCWYTFCSKIIMVIFSNVYFQMAWQPLCGLMVTSVYVSLCAMPTHEVFYKFVCNKIYL